MKSGRPLAPRPFTPSQEDPAELERRTVGRRDILATLAERLTTAAISRSRPHTLLVGPRGSGKSHLLRVALHRLDQTTDVGDRLAVADISEDAVGITRYTDLLWEIGASLGWQLSRSASVVELEETLLNGIGDKTLVLVVENLDRVFKSIGHSGQQNLRSWVETSGRVLLLAATPALFAGVADRNEPWFAGLITTPVDGLSAESGLELLTILARQRGDDALADFLQTDVGRARVEAVAQLTGGSARIWMVLSECLTIDSLDALIPAVEALVEGLVPYYQQLLWDLPDNHQAVVRQLAEGPAAALTASNIAGATGLSQQTVSKALSLLVDGRWVRAEKIERTDSRMTWYSLREPMLRHHFQWRSTRGEPLLLIVELLRAWYQLPELRRHLAQAQQLSEAENYLLRSLAVHPIVFDDAYNRRDIDELLAGSRRWMAGDSDVFTVDCGRYVEVCVALSKDPHLDIAGHLAARALQGDWDSAVIQSLSAERDAILSDLIRIAMSATGGDTKAGLAILAAGWAGPDDAEAAREMLSAIALDSLTWPATALALRLETIFWSNRAGGQGARDEAAGLLVELQVLGPDHPVFLRARSNMADYTAEAGDIAGALDMSRNLLTDLRGILGPDHPDTLTTRGNVAYYTGENGDPTTALQMYQDLLTDRQRILGPDHPETLSTRGQIAYCTGQTGDPTTALHMYQHLLTDRQRILGPDHPAVRQTRSHLAIQYAELGMADDAVELAMQDDDASSNPILAVLIAAPKPPSNSEVFAMLWHAFRGDPTATAKLPNELRDIASSVAANGPYADENNPSVSSRSPRTAATSTKRTLPTSRHEAR